MDKERFTERILETENLTDELEDADANWLLDWGTGKLDEVLRGVADEETAGNRVNALMAVMRKINRITGSYANKDPQELAGDLADLHALFAVVFPSSGAAPGAPESDTAVSSRAKKSPNTSRPFAILRWFMKGRAKTSPVQPPPVSREVGQPTPAGFEVAAARLASLTPRQALEYLAQDFYRSGTPPAARS